MPIGLMITVQHPTLKFKTVEDWYRFKITKIQIVQNFAIQENIIVIKHWLE
jgi:hypothetical protein